MSFGDIHETFTHMRNPPVKDPHFWPSILGQKSTLVLPGFPFPASLEYRGQIDHGIGGGTFNRKHAAVILHF